MVSALTLFIPSFSIMFLRCVITVVIPILSWSATSLLINPCTISDSTSISRSVKTFARRTLGSGGRFLPLACAACSSARIERTNCSSGTLIQRLWKWLNWVLGLLDVVRIDRCLKPHLRLRNNVQNHRLSIYSAFQTNRMSR